MLSRVHDVRGTSTEASSSCKRIRQRPISDLALFVVWALLGLGDFGNSTMTELQVWANITAHVDNNDTFILGAFSGTNLKTTFRGPHVILT